MRHISSSSFKQLIKNPEVLSHDESQRSEIQRLTRLAFVALETPQESMQRIMFTHLPLVTTRLSHEFGLLTTLINGDDTKPVALADLMKTSGLDKSLVSAIMDYHCYHGSAVQPRQGFYAPTKLTYNLLDPKVVTTLTCWHDIVGPAYGSLHRDLTSGPDGPDGSGKKTAFQVTHNTTQSFYDWLESCPEQHASFYGYIAAVHSVTTKWTDVVHFDKELTQNMQENEVVFVDISGGDGSQCIEVQKVHKLDGRIVMQDRAAVIEKAEMAREAGVETMVYDFFAEQPVKAARAYFIQFVLLNWTDDDCVRILASQAPAMGPDSVLMIVDYVQGHRWETKGELPEPDLWTPAAALAARACHNAVGRSGADYRELLERAGLELTEIRVFTKFGQAVIMAKKPTIARL
ncbi:S-adenosyl-L-methionine-dependent methyltransferase [Penicillium canescens]|nr:S-adenosyl-L-methionine-dependent methyltransferase [Penicillium canescens]